MESNKKEEPFLYVNQDGSSVLLTKKVKKIGDFIKEMKEVEEEEEGKAGGLELTPNKKLKP